MKKINIAILMILFAFVATAIPTFAKGKQPETDKHIEYLNLKWWDKYNDDILSSYLQDVYKNNQDLKIANLKTKQAQETVKMIDRKSVV